MIPKRNPNHRCAFTFSVVQGPANFLYKESYSKYFHLYRPVSVRTTQLRHCSVKAVVDSSERNDCGYVPIKLYLQKQSVDGIWFTVSDFPGPGLSSSPFHGLGKQSMGRENKLVKSHMAGKWQNWDSSPGSQACQPLLLATAPSCPCVNSYLSGMLISWNLPGSLPHLHKS